MSELESLRPKTKPSVMELVGLAGLDVSDWANFAGGPTKAGTNPKYCYEWCFEQEGMFVLNIWFENMRVDENGVFQRLNPLTYGANEGGIRRVRAERFVEAAKHAYESGSNPRVIILDRPSVGEGSASGRLLDRAPWTVVNWSVEGQIELRRGILTTESSKTDSSDEEAQQFLEGEMRESFVRHRTRERRLRELKLRSFKAKYGAIFCEVPGCGFDFYRTYGEPGEGFAEVHHLDPLSKALPEGNETQLDRLAVVCANCHRMIHRGGQCRSLDGLISEGKAHV